MRAVYDRERAALARATFDQRIRAQASIDRDCHMVGRVGRFRLESDEPADRGGTDTAPTPLQYLTGGAVLSISPNGPHVLECLACACRVPAPIAVMLLPPRRSSRTPPRPSTVAEQQPLGDGPDAHLRSPLPADPPPSLPPRLGRRPDGSTSTPRCRASGLLSSWRAPKFAPH